MACGVVPRDFHDGRAECVALAEAGNLGAAPHGTGATGIAVAGAKVLVL